MELFGYNSQTIDNQLLSKIKIHSNVRIAKPYGDKYKEQFEERLNKLLEQKYPQLITLKEEANWINEQPFYVEHPELQVKVQPKFHYSRGGLVSKIGLRATNRIVSLKEHDNGKDSGRMWRKDYLKSLFGDNYQSFDIKASIYQLTLALNTNDWLDNKIDMYREIYGQDFESTEQRDKFKSLCMPLYFDKSDKKAIHHIRQKAKLNEVMTDAESEFAIMSLRNRMKDTLGDNLFDSEVFLHESVIYNHVLLELIKLGWNVVQVYDGFYGTNKLNRNLSNDISNILDSYINYYIRTYIHNNSIIYNSGTIRLQ